VAELLANNIPEEEALLMKNGRLEMVMQSFACCIFYRRHNPIKEPPVVQNAVRTPNLSG